MHDDFLCEIILNRQSGELFFKVLGKKHSSLNQRLHSRDSKANSRYIFSLEVQRITSVLLYKHCIVFFLVFDELMHYRLGHKECSRNLDGYKCFVYSDQCLCQ